MPPHNPKSPEPPPSPLCRAVIFPFDLFGSGGAGEGATLLGEGLKEMLADNRQEAAPTRAIAYTRQVRLREMIFETIQDYQDWRKRGSQAIRQATRQDCFLLWLTGNHLGALPVYDHLGGKDQVLIVQLDAHLDVQQFSDQSDEPSHANFLTHCGKLPEIINVGHRDLLQTHHHVSRYYRQVISAAEVATAPDRVEKALRQAADQAGQIFLDLDCDVFEPAFFPAVAHPAPFGLLPFQALRLIEAIGPQRLQGIILSEFTPARDQNDHCLATLLWLLEYVLLRRFEKVPSPGTLLREGGLK